MGLVVTWRHVMKLDMHIQLFSVYFSMTPQIILAPTTLSLWKKIIFQLKSSTCTVFPPKTSNGPLLMKLYKYMFMVWGEKKGLVLPKASS